MTEVRYLAGEFFMSGCRFFAGYPITPATEIAERMSDRLPELGGTYLQMEDELGSMAASLDAVPPNTGKLNMNAFEQGFSHAQPAVI